MLQFINHAKLYWEDQNASANQNKLRHQMTKCLKREKKEKTGRAKWEDTKNKFIYRTSI